MREDIVECEEFRRSLADRPFVTPGPHPEQCPACREYLHDMAVVEERIRTTAFIALPPEILGRLQRIPQRHRARVRARNRVLITACAAIVLGALAPLVLETPLLTSGMALTGSFAAVSGLARARLIRD